MEGIGVLAFHIKATLVAIALKSIAKCLVLGFFLRLRHEPDGHHVCVVLPFGVGGLCMPPFRELSA